MKKSKINIPGFSKLLSSAFSSFCKFINLSPVFSNVSTITIAQLKVIIPLQSMCVDREERWGRGGKRVALNLSIFGTKLIENL